MTAGTEFSLDISQFVQKAKARLEAVATETIQDLNETVVVHHTQLRIMYMRMITIEDV